MTAQRRPRSNVALERAVERLVIEEDIVLTASVGNEGPAAQPSYPAAYELISREVERLPIKAVIFTHSHVDHFGGIKGIIDDDIFLSFFRSRRSPS